MAQTFPVDMDCSIEELLARRYEIQGQPGCEQEHAQLATELLFRLQENPSAYCDALLSWRAVLKAS